MVTAPANPGGQITSPNASTISNFKALITILLSHPSLNFKPFRALPTFLVYCRGVLGEELAGLALPGTACLRTLIKVS